MGYVIKNKRRLFSWIAPKTKKEKININEIDFSSKKDCRQFLENIYIGGELVTSIELKNGQKVEMGGIPDSQVIQRAKELRNAIKGIPFNGKG